MPTAQLAQAAALAAAYMPLLHEVLVVLLQYEPAGHAEHEVAPVVDWYWPATHLVHEAADGKKVNMPAGHETQEALPVCAA